MSHIKMRIKKKRIILVNFNIAYKTSVPHSVFSLLTQKIQCSAVHKFIFFLDTLKIQCLSELCGSTQLCFTFLPGASRSEDKPTASSCGGTKCQFVSLYDHCRLTGI